MQYGGRWITVLKIPPNPSVTASCVTLPPASMQSPFSKGGTRRVVKFIATTIILSFKKRLASGAIKTKIYSSQ
jgi:hypothetical protein